MVNQKIIDALSEHARPPQSDLSNLFEVEHLKRELQTSIEQRKLAQLTNAALERQMAEMESTIE